MEIREIISKIFEVLNRHPGSYELEMADPSADEPEFIITILRGKVKIKELEKELREELGPVSFRLISAIKHSWLLTISGVITTIIGLTAYIFFKPEIVGVILAITGLTLIACSNILDSLRSK